MLHGCTYGECEPKHRSSEELSLIRSLVTGQVETSYVCAYSSVQHYKSRVAKEFTNCGRPDTWKLHKWLW